MHTYSIYFVKKSEKKIFSYRSFQELCTSKQFNHILRKMVITLVVKHTKGNLHSMKGY